MADTKYDVIAVGGSYEADGKERNRFVRIGVAFPAKEGAGWTLKLDALPITVQGQATLIIREREEQRDRPVKKGI
jgi:hypothetical protein